MLIGKETLGSEGEGRSVDRHPGTEFPAWLCNPSIDFQSQDFPWKLQYLSSQRLGSVCSCARLLAPPDPLPSRSSPLPSPRCPVPWKLTSRDYTNGLPCFLAPFCILYPTRKTDRRLRGVGRGGGGRSIDSPGPSLALGSWPSLAGVLSQGSLWS